MVEHLAEGKFYPIFACLFGIGFALQFERWGDRRRFARMYVRRLLALFGIALLLVAFTGFYVLIIYAAWGFALLAMRRCSNRVLLVAALVCGFLAPARQLAVWQLEKRTMTVAQANEKHKRQAATMRAARAEEQKVKKEGRFRRLMILRLRTAFRTRPCVYWPVYLPEDSMVMFIAGLYAVRRRMLQDPRGNRRLLLIVLIAGGVLGIAGEVIPYSWPPFRFTDRHAGMAYFSFRSAIFGSKLGLAYAVALLLLISYSERARRAAAVLGGAGRMSLTNYVMQLVMLETLFASHTFHLPLTRPAALISAFLFFALQLVFSRWWIARFRYGPMEWFWRSLTYARWQPIRYPPPARAAATA
jgi:uncharacterized protein